MSAARHRQSTTQAQCSTCGAPVLDATQCDRCILRYAQARHQRGAEQARIKALREKELRAEEELASSLVSAAKEREKLPHPPRVQAPKKPKKPRRVVTKGREAFWRNRYGEPTRPLSSEEIDHVKGLYASGWLWVDISRAAGWHQSALSRALLSGEGSTKEKIAALMKLGGPRPLSDGEGNRYLTDAESKTARERLESGELLRMGIQNVRTRRAINQKLRVSEAEIAKMTVATKRNAKDHDQRNAAFVSSLRTEIAAKKERRDGEGRDHTEAPRGDQAARLLESPCTLFREERSTISSGAALVDVCPKVRGD